MFLLLCSALNDFQHLNSSCALCLGLGVFDDGNDCAALRFRLHFVPELDPVDVYLVHHLTIVTRSPLVIGVIVAVAVSFYISACVAEGAYLLEPI